MAYVVARGNVWYVRYKKQNGKWSNEPTPFKVMGPDGKPDPNAKRSAKRTADRKAQQIASRAGAPVGTLTVQRYADGWIERRREADLDWKNDRSRLKHHVLGVIGKMPIADVRAKNIADVVRRIRFVTRLAQRSVYNVYSVISAMFRDAAIDGEIEQTPCILTSQHLGPLIDKDPEWRDGAVYTREEAELILSHPEIPEHRRMYYAFMLLAGMRPGEIAVLRWRHYDAAVEPLGRIVVAQAHNTRLARTRGTKTGAVRHVPVHPTLAAMLAEFRLAGWEATYGRAPGPEDLLVPLTPAEAEARRSRKGEPLRTEDHARKRWDVDRKLIGGRRRAAYDMKSTFITLCGEDRADRDMIHRVTHMPSKRDAFDGYDRAKHWGEMCEAVSKLRMGRVPVRVPTVVSIMDRR